MLQSDYSEVIVVGAGADAVDYKLKESCKVPRKRTAEDDERFTRSFEKMVKMGLESDKK